MRRATLVAQTLWLALSAGGCSTLLGRSVVPWKYYVLNAEPTAVSDSSPLAANVAIGLGPIHLPSYLDRPQVVKRAGPNRLTFNDVERWGQPLAEGLGRVLADDLAQLLGSSTVVLEWWRYRTAFDYLVEVDVTRFEFVTDTNAAELTARWHILDFAHRKLLRDGTADLSRPVTEPSTTAAAAAMSAVAGDLARQLAEAIAQLQSGGPRARPRDARVSRAARIVDVDA